MENLVVRYTVEELVSGNPERRQPFEVVVQLSSVIANYESLPDSEALPCRLLILGYLHLECDARIEGLWSELQEASDWPRIGLLEPEPRLMESHRLLTELRKRRGHQGHGLSTSGGLSRGRSIEGPGEP